MTWKVLTLTTVVIGGGAGCRGQDISVDCDNQAMEFVGAAQTEEKSLREVPETGPYPVALHLSEAGINELLEGIIDEDVPFAGEVPFGILPQGPGEASFAAESPPVIELTPVPGCSNCIIFSIDFGVELQSDEDPLSSGLGFAKLAIPLSLRADAAAGTTTLVADYGAARIQDWYLSVYGFDSDTHTTLSGALQILLEEQIQAEYGEVELLDVGSWTIGNGDISLLAREVVVFPETRQVVLGMHTNLALDQGIDLDLAAPLPDDVPMLVAFDVDMMLPIAHRMLEEGQIARRYNGAGEADPNGTFGVTLHGITTTAQPSTLETLFRVWRIAEGYCGFANVSMPIVVAVNDAMTGIDVAAGDAILIPGDNRGIGVAAEEEQRIVDDNQDLVETFRGDLTKQIANALNFEDLAVEDSTIYYETRAVVIDDNAINSHVGFRVLPSE